MGKKETTSTSSTTGVEGYKGDDLGEIKKDRRETLIVQGADQLSDTELLEVLVSPGCKGKKAADIAVDLLHAFNKSLKDVCTATIHQLIQVKGIGFVKACRIKAGFELWKRTAAYCEDLEIRSPHDVVNLLGAHMMYLNQEEFRVILLDSRRRLIRHCRVSLGSLDAALVHPREVLRPAVTEGAAFIILVHNHPSGDPEASEQDILLTQELHLAGRVVSIEVLDHVIIGFRTYVSLKEQKVL